MGYRQREEENEYKNNTLLRIAKEGDEAVALVVGGNDAPKGVFEEIVCNLSGTGGFGHYCMCTIIAPNVALTAAHCYYPGYTIGDYVEIGKYYVNKDNRRNGKVSQFKIKK